MIYEFLIFLAYIKRRLFFLAPNECANNSARKEGENFLKQPQVYAAAITFNAI